MKLINGRGQLGELFFKNNLNNIDDTFYHTWNFLDKSKETQKKLYLDFINYINSNIEERIIFISTTSKEKNEYTKYKALAENYLIHSSDNYLIIRIPNIIGKGICEKFKTIKNIKPYGDIELITLENVFIKINEIIKAKPIGIRNISGNLVPANIVMNLIKFGVKNR